MKKLLAFLFVVVLMTSLSACGKSKAAAACEKSILQLGEVSLSAESALGEAEEAYNALSEEEKEQIPDAAEQLSDFRRDYNVLYVQDLIAKIGEVAVDSISSIEEAEKAYNALSEEEKEQIPDVAEQLSNVRRDYNVLYVRDLIAKIGEVTLDSLPAIEEAEAAYETLSPEERALLRQDGVTLSNARYEYENAKKVVASIDLTTNIGTVEYVGVEKATRRLLDSYNSMNCAIVKFDFTNNQSKPLAVVSAFTIHVYQNGRECNDSIVYSSADPRQFELCGNDFSNTLKGGTVTFGHLVQIQDNSPLTIIVSERLNSNNYQVMELDISSLS